MTVASTGIDSDLQEAWKSPEHKVHPHIQGAYCPQTLIQVHCCWDLSGREFREVGVSVNVRACVCQCHISQVWRCTFIISAFEVLKQEDLRFKASLVYVGSSRPAWTVRHCLRKKGSYLYGALFV